MIQEHGVAYWLTIKDRSYHVVRVNGYYEGARILDYEDSSGNTQSIHIIMPDEWAEEDIEKAIFHEIYLEDLESTL